jgi:hypothetical protein
VRKLFKTGKKIPPSSIQPSLGKKKNRRRRKSPWSGFQTLKWL